MTEAYSTRTPSAIRKMIAARTLEAKQTIPHFRLRAELEVDEMLSARRSLPAEERPSVTDLLVKGCADALMATPALNIQWTPGEIRQWHSADISVVVALPDGVSTPIVRSAEVKSIAQIGRELRELARRAQTHTLKAEELLGGSFSISNLGMYDVTEFDAIINPPQCAILAVGAARACVLPGEEGCGTRIGAIIRLTLSCDHRAVDGAIGARFLKELKRRLEDPDYLRGLTRNS